MFQIKREMVVGVIITLVLLGITVIYGSFYSTPKINPETSNVTDSAVLSELAKHNTATDCWIIIDQKVLDVTSFLDIHPGGAEAIIPYCGKDATNAFNAINEGKGHPASAVALFEKYLVKLVGRDVTGEIKTATTPTPVPALNQSNTPTKQSVSLSWEEVAKHNTPADCWIVINNKVLKITPFLAIHPGGEKAITPYCGKDATAAFDQVGHSNRAVSLFVNYLAGMIGQTIEAAAPPPQNGGVQLINTATQDIKTEEVDDD